MSKRELPGSITSIDKKEVVCNTGRVLQVGLTRTKNLGNYENIKIHVGLTNPINDTEDLQEAFTSMFDQLFEQLNQQEEMLKGD